MAPGKEVSSGTTLIHVRKRDDCMAYDDLGLNADEMPLEVSLEVSGVDGRRHYNIAVPTSELVGEEYVTLCSVVVSAYSNKQAT